jgi:hypothetical protein
MMLEGAKCQSDPAGTTLSAYEDVITATKFTPESPPSTQPRPGWVFAVVNDAVSGQPYRRTLCDDINQGRFPPKADSIAIPTNLSSTQNLKLEATAKLAEGLLKNISDAELTADATNVTSVTFKGDGAHTWELQDVPTNDGVERTRPVPAGCIKLDLYQQNGKYTVPVYLVTQSLSLDSMDLTFNGSGGPTLASKLSVKGIVDAGLNVDATHKDQGELSFKAATGQEMYVGTHLLKLPSAAMVTQVGAVTQRKIAALPVADVDARQIESLPIESN